MSFGDAIGYLTLGNPISQAVINTASTLIKSTGLQPKQPPVKPVEMNVKQLQLSELAGRNNNFVRIAGINGALAVCMGVFIKEHLDVLEDPKEREERRKVFENANRFHILHSVALMAVPLAKRPMLTGSLMAAGTLLFSGPSYYHALTGDKSFANVAVCGGFVLIASWLTLVL